MRLSFLRGFAAILFGTFAALGLIGSVGTAGATTGVGAQVAATQWTTMPTVAIPSASTFDDDVSCVSSNFCVATVGDQGEGTTPFVQDWNGSSLVHHDTPSPIRCNWRRAERRVMHLGLVLCRGRHRVVALSGHLGVIELWNGNSWSASTGAGLPSGFTASELNGVSCTGPAWCMATGRHG